MKITLFQGILMGIFGLGALIGLFMFATYKGAGSAQAIGPVVIWGVLPKASVESTLTNLAVVDTDLKEVTYVQKDPSTLATDLATAIATDNSPDLILASQEELIPLLKLITPIPLTRISAADFQNAFVKEAGLLTAAAGAGYYGIPFLIDPLVLYSNRTILSSNGIVRPPATWESLTGLVPTVAQLSSTRQVIRPLIALGTYTNIRSARGILSTLFLQTNVPISGFGGNGLLSGDLGSRAETGVAPGQSVLGFYTQFSDPTKVSYTWNQSLPDSEQLFLSGDMALYIGYASRDQYLRAANPNLDFVMSTMPQPATASTKKVYGLLYSFMISRKAKNPEGAFQIAALLSHANEQATAAATIGLAPASLSQLAVTPASSSASIAYAEALYAEGWLSPAALDTDQIFSGMIGDMISGRSTSETALTVAEQSLSSYLQK